VAIARRWRNALIVPGEMSILRSDLSVLQKSTIMPSMVSEAARRTWTLPPPRSCAPFEREQFSLPHPGVESQ
jgi:hypothetical protein